MRVAAAVLLTIPLIACSTQTVPPPPPTQTAVAQSQAANLRTHLDLLLGEHVMIVAKESAAAVNHADEYPAYTALLGANATDLATQFGRAYGTSAAAQFGKSWDVQNGALVDYAIAVVTHNDDKANAVTAALTGTYATQFGQMIETTTGISATGMRDLAYRQVLLDKAFIDDAAAQNYSNFYADVDKAYTHTSQLGDALARHAVAQFPDRLAGDPSARSVESRVSFNLLTQEHSYLTTMATDATIAKRGTEKTAAAGALAVNARQLGRTWSGWDAAVMSSATGGELRSENLVDVMSLATGASRTEVQHLIDATNKAIGDQKAKNARSLAEDDRAAATAMQPIADSIQG